VRPIRVLAFGQPLLCTTYLLLPLLPSLFLPTGFLLREGLMYAGTVRLQKAAGVGCETSRRFLLMVCCLPGGYSVAGLTYRFVYTTVPLSFFGRSDSTSCAFLFMTPGYAGVFRTALLLVPGMEGMSRLGRGAERRAVWRTLLDVRSGVPLDRRNLEEKGWQRKAENVARVAACELTRLPVSRAHCGCCIHCLANSSCVVTIRNSPRVWRRQLRCNRLAFRVFIQLCSTRPLFYDVPVCLTFILLFWRGVFTLFSSPSGICHGIGRHLRPSP